MKTTTFNIKIIFLTTILISNIYAWKVEKDGATQLKLTDDGKFGVGTISPDAQLDIVAGRTAYPPLEIQRNYDGGRVRFQYANYTDAYGEIGQTYYRAGKTRMWMGANLNSFTDSHSTNPIQGNSNGPSWYTKWDTISDNYSINRIAPGGGVTSPLFIDRNDNVGIGTTTPKTKLDVHGYTFLGGRLQLGSLSTSWINDPLSDFTEPNVANDAFIFIPGYTGTETSDLRLYMLDNSSERFSIWGDSCGGGNCGDLNAAKLKHFFMGSGQVYHSGNIGIKTLNPTSTLQLGDSLGNDGGVVQINIDDNFSKSQAIKSIIKKTSGSNFGVNGTAYGVGADRNIGLYGYAGGATENFGLWVNHGYGIFDDRVGIGTQKPLYKLHVEGTAYATGAAGSLSDKRDKKNIESLNVGLNVVEKLHPVKFEWKNPIDAGMQGKQIGFIAQEVEKILPSIVMTENDSKQTKALKYNEFIPILVKALQEMKKKNDQLENRIKILENQINSKNRD